VARNGQEEERERKGGASHGQHPVTRKHSNINCNIAISKYYCKIYYLLGKKEIRDKGTGGGAERRCTSKGLYYSTFPV
jgi:hypothetical protein